MNLVPTFKSIDSVESHIRLAATTFVWLCGSSSSLCELCIKALVNIVWKVHRFLCEIASRESVNIRERVFGVRTGACVCIILCPHVKVYKILSGNWRRWVLVVGVVGYIATTTSILLDILSSVGARCTYLLFVWMGARAPGSCWWLMDHGIEWEGKVADNSCCYMLTVIYVAPRALILDFLS